MWDPAVCIQCDKCVLVCPHAVIRAKVFDPTALDGAPEAFKTPPPSGRSFRMQRTPSRSRPRTAPAAACASRPARPRTRATPAAKPSTWCPQPPLREQQAANWDFFLGLPEVDPSTAEPHLGQGLRSCCSRCSSFPARAPAAAKHHISNCCRSCSAIARSSPTPPAARPSTAATCRRRHGPRTTRAAARPGPTRCSRTTPSSASASA